MTMPSQRMPANSFVTILINICCSNTVIVSEDAVDNEAKGNYETPQVIKYKRILKDFWWYETHNMVEK
jgi:hypothetical protein